MFISGKQDRNSTIQKIGLFSNFSHFKPTRNLNSIFEIKLNKRNASSNLNIYTY